MMVQKRRESIYLAEKWTVADVRKALRQHTKERLVRFVDERFRERYFAPIESLRRGAARQKRYGFAMMSLCSLLVETIQCYRYGLPCTGAQTLKKLKKQYPRVPRQCRPRDGEARDAREAFRCFFCDNAADFPGVDGDQFYQHIRNGLLHQAQTTGRWRIQAGRNQLWDARNRIIDRNLFARSLKRSFERYLRELRDAKRNQSIYRNFERKIGWLAHLSEQRPINDEIGLQQEQTD